MLCMYQFSHTSKHSVTYTVNCLCNLSTLRNKRIQTKHVYSLVLYLIIEHVTKYNRLFYSLDSRIKKTDASGLRSKEPYFR